MSQSKNQIDAHLAHGKRLHSAGHLREAGLIYEQVLAAAPDHAEAMDMFGVLLLQNGQPGPALAWIDRAIARKNTASFHVHRAHALLATARPADAAMASRIALTLKRTGAEAHQALGHALTDLGEYESAIKAYQDAVRLKPNLPDVLNNLGTALHHANRLEEAARTLARAVAHDPRDVGPLVNLSTVLRDLGRFDDSAARLATAARLAPADPRIHYNNAWLDLLSGRFETAWDGWEHRFAAGAVPDRTTGRPRWHGEPLNGRTLLIQAEQGFGDTIQFLRFIQPLDGPVVFEAQPRLAHLLGFNPPPAQIMRAGDPLPPHDLVCPLMSLPAIARITEATIPVPIPYVSASPEAIARWAERIGPAGFRIGIAWQGNAARREDIGRSPRLDHFLPLATVPNTRLISLQKDSGFEQLTPDMPVETLSPDFDAGPDGFIDTAAVMASLDLIITSDTAIAHLAGAMGRPVWVVLKTVPDWRWMLGRTDSPWYPTMRLFRQTTRGDWAPVFTAIRAALEAMHG